MNTWLGGWRSQRLLHLHGLLGSGEVRKLEKGFGGKSLVNFWTAEMKNKQTPQLSLHWHFNTYRNPSISYLFSSLPCRNSYFSALVTCWENTVTSISFCSLLEPVRDSPCLLLLVSIEKNGKVRGGIFNFKSWCDFP